MRTVRLWAGCARGEREVVVASDPRIKSGGKQSSGTSGDSCSPGSPRRFAARDDDAGHPDKGLERLRIVAFGWGNDARGDDGLGPLLLGRLARADYGNVTTIEDFQLQIEHALDLDGAELSLFIDAGKGTPAPFAFAEIVARRDPSHTTHALSPAALLDACARALGHAPPPAFSLCVRGESFELGEGLSSQGAERLEAAWAFLQELMRAPSVEAWRETVGGQRLGDAAQSCRSACRPLRR